MAKTDKKDTAKGKTATDQDKTVSKPRVRKVKAETIRERNEKVAAKADAKASKTAERQSKQRVRKTAGKVAKPFKKPLHILAWPFRTRPMRFIGRTLGRIFWPKYFRDSWQEIKLVTWPSRRDTWKLTLAVLIFAVVFGLAATGVDWVLDKIIRRIVFKA